VPEPFTGREIFPRLHRDPIGARGEDGWYAQGYHEVAGSGVGLAERGVNERPRQTGAILVKVNVESRGRATSAIFAHHVHFGDIPCLAPGYHEVVSCLVVEGNERRFEVLRSDVNRRDHCSVVVLVVENYRRKFRHWQNPERRNTGGSAGSCRKLRRVG
jgi:hypothetical protein